MVNGGAPTPVLADIDSGGVQGTITFNAQPGDVIRVYAPDGTPVYQYHYNQTYFPTPSTGAMNTGAGIFWLHPIYIDYSPAGIGTTLITSESSLSGNLLPLNISGPGSRIPFLH